MGGPTCGPSPPPTSSSPPVAVEVDRFLLTHQLLSSSSGSLVGDTDYRIDSAAYPFDGAGLPAVCC